MGLPTWFSCIDLTSTNKPNLVFENGAHAFFYLNCHHQVIFVNLTIGHTPVYKCLIQNYKKAGIDMINRAIELFDWGKVLEGKNVHDQVCLFNKAILNIFHNFIFNKTITCGDKEPPWFKGCVHYIFASLFCMPIKELLWNKENCFLFHFESSFRSWENKILTFQIFKFHDVIECLNMKHETQTIE